ncbi:cbb3-type cytochrome c oxidase subunit II [Opitutales bacterium]|nr:cbb3-type cytochrome c oxidase subunit II [Opitutales bacterium]
MNNIFKFSGYIFLTLAFAWLAFVVGAKNQYGDLTPSSESLEENGSNIKGEVLYPQSMAGIAQLGAKEYLSLGCVTCHTQQVRSEESGFDVQRGWGKRPSVPRDYILQEDVLIGHNRVGPDLANVGLRDYTNEWLHKHLFMPQMEVEGSICQPSPFLYKVSDEPSEKTIEAISVDNKMIYIEPSIQASRIVAYLQSLEQNYELPEVSFIESDIEADELVETADTQTIDNEPSSLPSWLSEQINSGKEIYMKAAPGGGLCFTCHQPNGQGIAGQFPPLADSDWVLGDKERLIKISIYGLMGEIEVNGVKYNNVMVPPGIPPGSLTDNQIADVLTYIRNDWGNSASSVSAEEVATVRESIKGRAPMQMWTAAELNKKSDSE